MKAPDLPPLTSGITDPSFHLLCKIFGTRPKSGLDQSASKAKIGEARDYGIRKLNPLLAVPSDVANIGTVGYTSTETVITVHS